MIVGVHTPEFAFEREPDNVRQAVERLGIEYPVALDNGYGTWNAWLNRYWPAKYFIDRRGRIRYAHFGEGDYEESERVIRTLLAEEGLPAAGLTADRRTETPPGTQTPETYLGWQRLDRFVGSKLIEGREASYRIPDVRAAPRRRLRRALDGRGERIVAGDGRPPAARLHARRRFTSSWARTAGRRPCEVRSTAAAPRTVRVAEDDLYTLARVPGRKRDHSLDLRFSPGTEAYAFTFG